MYKIKPSYLSVLQKRAKDFAKNHNYQYLDFGADYEETINEIAKTMEKIISIMGEPSRIFCAIGSGTLAKGILKGTKKAEVWGVQVGKDFKFEL